jgi:hypothetical protein
VLWITEQPNVASKTKTPFGGSWSCHKRSVCVWGSPGLAATAGFDRPTLCASSIIVDRTPMALHEQSVGATDEWFTPPYVFDALGCEFDMNVTSPGQDLTPWIPARRFVTCHGLAAPWSGFVWMNPPSRCGARLPMGSAFCFPLFLHRNLHRAARALAVRRSPTRASTVAPLPLPAARRQRPGGFIQNHHGTSAAWRALQACESCRRVQRSPPRTETFAMNNCHSSASANALKLPAFGFEHFSG